MYRRTVLATIVALLATPAAALAARGPAVLVRVEGVHRPLLVGKVVRVKKGSITRDGAPSGDCSAKSAAGALNIATHRRWGGLWTTSSGDDYEVMSVLGEAHNWHREAKYYWEIFTDNVPASLGVCELKLHRGEHLLFAAVPQTGNAYPTAIKAPPTAAPGQPFTVKVVWFDAQGKPHALPGAQVSGGAMTVTTNSSGLATLTAPGAGALVLHAHHAWSASTAFVRAAPVTVDVS